MTFVAAMLIFVVGLYFAQSQHYAFKREAWKQSNSEMTEHALGQFRDEFEDYKKRVDALTIRAGFKT